VSGKKGGRRRRGTGLFADRGVILSTGGERLSRRAKPTKGIKKAMTMGCKKRATKIRFLAKSSGLSCRGGNAIFG